MILITRMSLIPRHRVYNTSASVRQPNAAQPTDRRPRLYSVVKMRGLGWGLSPLLPVEPPCNSMSPLIESIKCYFMPFTALLVFRRV